MQGLDFTSDLALASILDSFLQISAIPRPSGKEDKIADFLCEFAKKNHLEYQRDAHENVLIRRAASKGMENRPVYLFQGHTDMVCEKTADSTHDFDRDGITVLRDGDFLRADRTTLGADNGIAVAIMMTLLTQNDFPMPQIECLFTSAEETGLCGALGFDGSQIRAQQMINLDTEDINEMVLGCAESFDVSLSLPLDSAQLPSSVCALHKCVHLKIEGMAGGHSGVDIDKGHQNALLLCASLLYRLYEETPFSLVSFTGGGRLNVIPSACEAVIAIPDAQAAIDRLKQLEREVRTSFGCADSKARFRFTKKGAPTQAITYHATGQILRLLTLYPNGIAELLPNDTAQVATSSNAGRVQLSETAFTVSSMCRSSAVGGCDRLQSKFQALARVMGADCAFTDRSPGWNFSPDNPLAEDYAQSFTRITGRSLQRNVIHAGLECGVLQSKIPHPVHAISIGPTMYDVHSVAERLQISTVSTLYEVLRDFLSHP